MAIGNILRHEYHRIADDVIRAVIAEYLLPLKTAVETIQQSVGDNG